jgi:hypothetical protein
MQATTSRISIVSLFRIGVVIGILALLAYGAQTFHGAPSIPASIVASEPGQLSIGQTVAFPSIAGDVSLTVTSVDGNQATLTDGDGDSIVFSLAQIVSGVLPFEDVEENVRRHRAFLKEQAAANGYSSPGAPAGWCNATDCPPTLVVSRPVQQQPVVRQAHQPVEQPVQEPTYRQPRGVGPWLQDWMQGNTR